MSLTRMRAREAFPVPHLGLPEDKDPGGGGAAWGQFRDRKRGPCITLGSRAPCFLCRRQTGAKLYNVNVHNDILLQADVRRERRWMAGEEGD